MKSNTQTTYILLERGVEDRALWKELDKISAALEVKSYRDFIKNFPLLWELKSNLKIELDEHNEN